MRYDSIGMFWQDKLPEKGKRAPLNRPMPPIPETGWIAPTDFPNLSAAKALAIDTETWDPDLMTSGPGWGRGRGHIVGVSIAVPDGTGWYFPVRHEVEREANLDPANVFGWLKSVLETNVPKIGANLLYDLGWLKTEGIDVRGPFYDVQHAEALLDSEAPDVSLDSLAAKYLARGKESSMLYQWCSDFYGGQPNDRQRANIYRSPPRLVGPYAEADATLPMAILHHQWALMSRNDVHRVFDLESRLIPLLLRMRWQGVPVDIPAAERFHERLSAEMKVLLASLKEHAGMSVSPYSSAEMAKAFTQAGLSFPRTEKGAPSFTAPYLETVNHPLASIALEYKRKAKLQATFIKGYLLDSHVNGRIYCEFNQLKSDDSGARSGRFSSSNPNLQNIPVRSEEGKLIRELFVARVRWRKFDYSQIEYRMLAHHAVGPGSEGIRIRYRQNPDTDYHKTTGDMLQQLLGLELDRRPVKTINFGLIYGMGKPELIKRLKLGEVAGENLFDAYHQAVPFARATAQAASNEASQKGYIRTILGRRSDFNMWSPVRFNPTAQALPFAEALMTYGKIQRAFTHKALNRKLQGGAADVMKKAMVDVYEAGIFDEVGYPLLTVHDELDFDDVGDLDNPAWKDMIRLMENGIPEISVPIKVDMDIGKNWGDCG